ncbi:MAG: hypothetical protein HYU99_00595 [Deltaproteobacteria bacterium]|nr:hypothetical protein [Deltaproteobacteria bacterium]
MRNKCQKKGVNTSTPDAHIAQSTLDIAGILYTSDSVFSKIPESIKLKYKIFPKKPRHDEELTEITELERKED